MCIDLWTETQRDKDAEIVRCISICGQKPREIKVQRQSGVYRLAESAHSGDGVWDSGCQ